MKDNDTPRQKIILPRQPISHDPEFEISSAIDGHINGEIGLEGSNPHRY